MANPEHVKLIKQGAEIWNRWFNDHSEVTPDLSGSDLSNIRLAEVNLSGANLKGTVFTQADLTLADLSMTNLSDAVFLEADLTAVDFRGTNLNNADLRKAKLQAATFGFTDLIGTNFSGADFSLTMLNAIDLSQTINLEEATHSNPSSIGVDTLYKSHGQIPDTFLHGCGVPESMIGFSRTLN